MLQNAYLLAKIGADTAENEQHFAEILPKTGNYPTGPTSMTAHPDARGGLRRAGAGRGPLQALHGLREEGRVSKISKIGKLIFANFWRARSRLYQNEICKKICVWQHFSSSTRYASFCTVAISKFSQKIGFEKSAFSWKFSIFFLQILQNLQILPNFKNFS